MRKATIKETNKFLKNKTEFCDILEENIKGYSGEFKEIIIYAPKIYKLMCALLDSPNINKSSRNRISSAIAYFILPKDIFPEEIFGTKGYIDDMYLCLHELRKINDEYEFEELLQYWDDEPRILKNLLSKEYEKIDEKLNYILNDMLKYIGLN
jgi:uncharacterized membrane protein YkvA (DUF1232 family)